ncbi:MAG: hypothetical protein ACI4V7_09450 [Succinivibrionaceae bacterium]
MNTELILINKKTKFEYEYETLEDGSSRLSYVSIYNSTEYNDGTFIENNSEVIYTYEEFDKVIKEIEVRDDIKRGRVKQISTYDKSTRNLIQIDTYINDEIERSVEYLNVEVNGEATRLPKIILDGVYKTIFIYDDKNNYRLLSEVFLNTKTKATQVAMYEYDEFGNIKRRYGDSSNRLNFDVYYTYQPKNKIKTKMIRYSNGTFEFIEYNSRGDIVFYSCPSIKKTYCYTSDGKLIMRHETIIKKDITIDKVETRTYDSEKEEGYEYVTIKTQTLKFKCKKGKFYNNTTSTKTYVNKYKITEDNRHILVSSVGKYNPIYECETKDIYTLDDNNEVTSVEIRDKNNGELLSTTVYNNSEFVKEIIETDVVNQMKFIHSCTYDENHNLITNIEESRKLLDYFPA